MNFSERMKKTWRRGLLVAATCAVVGLAVGFWPDAPEASPQNAAEGGAQLEKRQAHRSKLVKDVGSQGKSLARQTTALQATTGENQVATETKATERLPVDGGTGGDGGNVPPASAPAGNAGGNWPEPSKIVPNGRIVAYRSCELPPRVKGEAPGELHEWLMTPNEGYSSHAEEEFRPNDQGELELVATRHYVANQVMMTLDAETSFEEFRQQMAKYGAVVKEPLMETEKGGKIVAVMVPDISFDAVSNLKDAVRECNPQLTPENDNINTVSRVPNDTRWSNLWGMTKISAPSAWDSRTDSSSILVAVLDTGIRYTHEDLSASMWQNPSPGSYSGVTGDTYGMRCIGGVKSGNPMDDNSHGSHCAGTIGGAGNNSKGVAGVAWKAKIMALKFLNANGSGSDSDAIVCMNYAKAKGVKVLSCSFGGAGYNSSMYSAISTLRSSGVVMVAAAGNSGTNNDSQPQYPASYSLDNIISVAATTSSDTLASFSCYGATSVDIAAPGVGIWSSTSDSNSSYDSYQGTSMATPHVAGAVALVWAYNPSLSYSQVISRILDNGDAVSALSGKVRTGKRLNVNRAMGSGSDPTTPDPGTTLDAPVVTASRGTYRDRVVISWPAVSGATHYKLYWASSLTGTKYNLTSSWQTACSYTDYDVSANHTYYYFVQAAASSSGSRASNYSVGVPGWPGTGGDQWDPTDDQPSTGTQLTPTTTVQTHGSHTLDATDRYDFFRIQMTAGRTYYFESTGSFDMYGELFSTASTNSSYRVDFNDDGGDSYNFKLEYKPAASQTYYLRVRRYAVGLETTYSLKYWYVQTGDAWDPDDTTGTATAITPTSSLQTHGTHTLDSSDTSDCFKMTLYAGQTYVFYTRGGCDTIGELFLGSLASGSSVAYNDDGHDETTGSIRNFLITYTPSVTGTYYLRVRAYNTLSISYTLAYQMSGSSSLPDLVYTPVSDFREDGAYSWTANGFMTTSTSGRSPVTTFTTGQTIYYRWAVSDADYAAVSRPFTNYIRVVNSANAQVADGNIVVSSIQQNGLVINTSTLPSMSTGSYTLTSTLNQDRNGNHTLVESNYGNNSKTVTFTVLPPEKVLDRIAISGNATVPAEGSATYRCTATYTDGTTSSVSPNWSLNSTYASISASGVLTVGSPSTSQSVTITATYSGKTATKTVTIQAVPEEEKPDPFDEPVAYPTAPMIIEAVARIDGALAEAGDVVAAMVGSEVRGLGTVAAAGRVTLSVSLGAAGESVSFKIWDASEGDDGMVYNGSQVLVGEPGGIEGSVANPFGLSFGSSDPFGDPVVSPSAPTIIEAKVLIDGTPADSGDILAAFDGETLVGKQVLTFSGSLSGNSGKATGSLLMFLPSRRTLTFKVWDASEQAICICTSSLTLSPGETRGTVASPFEIATRSTSEWNTPVTLNLPSAGWHLVSFSVLPELARPATVFDAVRNSVDYVADGSSVWSPSGINQLGTIAIGQAYWVKTKTSNVSWTVEGFGAPDTTVHLLPGWNMVGYTLPRSGPVSRVLASAITSGKLNYVASGTSLYSPRGGNNSMSTMVPGVGYWINVNAAYDLKFDYDGMSAATTAMTMATASPDEYGPFGNGPNCENEMQAPTILKDVSFTVFGKRPAVGDCVAVYRVGTDERVAVAKFNDETGVISLPIYKSSGTYQFKLWNAASGLTNPQVFTSGSGSNVTLSGSGQEITGLTVSFAGTKPTYTVTFDLDGKATRTGGGQLKQQIAFGGAATPPTFAPLAGLTFAHWSNERFGDVRSDMTIKAIFSGRPTGHYFIEFVKNDGAGVSEVRTFPHGTLTALPTLASLGWPRRGYDFVGWATSTADARAGKVWKTDGKQVSTPVAAGSKLTVYAIWKLKSDYYEIRFEKNDGTSKWRALGYEYGKATALPTCEVGLGWTRAGYEFGGWATSAAKAEAGTVWRADKATVATAAAKGKTLTVYAIWKRAYKIRFIRNDGSGTMETKEFSSGVSSKLPTVAELGFARRGYTFGGWATTTAKARDKNYWKLDGASVKDATTAGKTLDVYAIWTLKSNFYEIRFEKNDGTGKWRVLGYEYGKNTALPSCGAGLGWTVAGKTFDYWSTSTSGSKWKADQAIVAKPVNAGRTLTVYAIWKTSARAMSAVGAASAESVVPTLVPDYIRGVFEGGTGVFDLLFADDGTAFFRAESADGVRAVECEAELVDGTLVLTFEDAEPLVIRMESGAWIVE